MTTANATSYDPSTLPQAAPGPPRRCVDIVQIGPDRASGPLREAREGRIPPTPCSRVCSTGMRYSQSQVLFSVGMAKRPSRGTFFEDLSGALGVPSYALAGLNHGHLRTFRPFPADRLSPHTVRLSQEVFPGPGETL